MKSSILRISQEVRQALLEKKPIVSLESTIITHGLPFPANVEMAQAVEAKVRARNAVPATIAFVKGQPTIGLSHNQLLSLAESKSLKVSRRDIPYVMATKKFGGTTIASTMILSQLAGIKVFATGGLGGVHKGGESTLDISADLDELSKTNVAVVCSGPKAILDVGLTMEYLETKGVPVATIRNDGCLNIPGFYTSDSKVVSPYVIKDPQTAARMMQAAQQMDLQGGFLFCVPPPNGMDPQMIRSIIDEAQLEADRLKVSGKSLTPFLLGRINAVSADFVKNNVALVLHNADLAAQIANHLLLPNTALPDSAVSFPTAPLPCDNLVVGSICVDSTSKLAANHQMQDSNPGSTSFSVGGVGYNVARAAHACTSRSRFISIYNMHDPAGARISEILKDLPSDCVNSNLPTAQYTSIHDHQGSLIVACADMAVVESLTFQQLESRIRHCRPKYVLVDANLCVATLNAICRNSENLSYKVVYEPTSVVKANRLGQCADLSTFPNNSVNLITPTLAELEAMHDSFYKEGKFNVNNWFPVMDALAVDSMFQTKLSNAKDPLIQKYIKQGVFVKAFKLLPYCPNILIKDGANGILLVQIAQHASPPSSENFILMSKGKSDLGVLVQHFPVPRNFNPGEIQSVTGAGDSLVGYILSELGRDDSWLQEASNEKRYTILKNSQVAAGLSLVSKEAVNVDLMKKTFHST